MAKSIVVERNGNQSSFAFKKVDRSKLYGRRRRMHLDPAGRGCARASLTDDGSLILRQGMTAQGYFDEGGQWIQQKELVGLNADGQPVDSKPSTLGRTVALEGPVAARDFLSVRVYSVYALEPEDMDEALAQSLKDGEIYRLPFNYRPGWEEGSAWLVSSMEGEFFALVGRQVEHDWCAPHELPQVEDEDDFDDDLDFEMF